MDDFVVTSCPESFTMVWIWQRVQRGNANGLFAALRHMEEGHLAGVGTWDGIIRTGQLFFYLLIGYFHSSPDYS